MFGSSRISLKQLASLSRRLAISLAAGIEMRRFWALEADRSWGMAQGRIRAVSEAVQQRESLVDALAATGDFFPTLFREMVAVGEETGHLPDVFRQLADQYELQLSLRRTFLRTITWPLIQLVLTILVIGLLIWVMGVIAQTTGTKVDILGFGLVGNQGLAIYAAFVAGVVAVLAAAIHGARRGLLWTRPLQRLVDALPVLGSSLRTLSLARFTWTLAIAANSSMNIRRAMRLSLQSTRSLRFTEAIDAVDQELAAGHSVHESLTKARFLPVEFLDTLQAAELSGSLPEAMQHVSRQYQEQAQAALVTLTALAGYAVWVLVAVIIILLIFRLAAFYFGAINDALNMR